LVPWYLVSKKGDIAMKEPLEVRFPVSSKESIERIIKNFKLLIGPEGV
jgi:hypothetical protein